MRYILVLLILSLFVTACKNTCEGFPEDELKWVPFEINEKIKYSYDGNTIEFTVKDNFSSEGGKYGGEPDPEFCTPIAWYQTDKSDSIIIYEEIQLISAYPYMTTSFSTNSIFKYELRDGYSFNSISVKHIGDTVLNGTEFNEVFEIVKDSQNGINWFIKADSIGIISFGERDQNKKWTQIQ